MQSTTMIKHVLAFNKKAFDDSFKAVLTVQEHAEKMMRIFWEKSMYFPQEGKKVLGDWVDTYKKGLDEFKTSVDGRFQLVEDYLLNAADQMERSFNAVGQQTQSEKPADRTVTKAALDLQKIPSRKPAVKKARISRKKADKQ